VVERHGVGSLATPTLFLKNKYLRPFCLFGLLIFVFVPFWLSSSKPAPAQDNTTLVVFSRHTFRGISEHMGPQKISLPKYGINIQIPTLSYDEDATPQGLFIAEHFAAPGLQKAAALAVKAVGEDKVFDSHWRTLAQIWTPSAPFGQLFI
jgi:hypothetical protein